MNRKAFPLFWKFAFAIIIMVGVFGTINTLVIIKGVEEFLTKEVEKRGLSIAHGLAKHVTEPLLYNDIIALQRLIDDAKSINPSVAYAFLVDERNRVIVNSHGVYPSFSLRSANIPVGGNQPSIRHVLLSREQQKPIVDIAVPVFDGKIGVVRLGIFEDSIRSDVRQTITTFLIMVAVFLSLGIVGAFIFSLFITKRVKAVIQVAEQLDLTNPSTLSILRVNARESFFKKLPISFVAEDELDFLGRRFNDMIERLEKAYADLQSVQASLIRSERLASLGTLAAGVAHEINNPIAGLENCVRRMSQDPHNIEQNKKYLSMMDLAAEKIHKVVRGLLNFSRHHEHKEEPVHLTSIVENALMLLGYRLEKDRIIVEKNFAEHVPPIRGNANQLDQVIVNLLLNAIDAIEERQPLDPLKTNKIIFTLSSLNGHVALSIKDSGIGITDENPHKIFDPFFTTKPTGKGTGLGLSICYQIVRDHGGEIAVESALGEGSLFTILLPINQKEV